MKKIYLKTKKRGKIVFRDKYRHKSHVSRAAKKNLNTYSGFYTNDNSEKAEPELTNKTLTLMRFYVNPTCAVISEELFYLV